MAAPKTLQQAILYYSDYENCRQAMMKYRWPDGKIACPHCGSEKVTYLEKARIWKCYGKHAKPRFSLKTGTIFEDSPIGLETWMPVMWMLVNSKNGVSSWEIHRAMGITQKTAWFMLQRGRLALQDSDALKSYEGLDEEYAHQVIDHAVSYVDGQVHTNGLENFWSLLKRGINGTYVWELYTCLHSPSLHKSFIEPRFVLDYIGVVSYYHYMVTYKTLTDARQISGDGAVAIAEIDHSSNRRCYIRIKASMVTLRKALAVKPMPEIVALVAEHAIMTPDQAEAERASQEIARIEDLRKNTRCHGCNKRIDGTVAKAHKGATYLGSSKIKVTDYYCDTCYNVRSEMGDWGVPVLEQSTKGDM